MLMRTDPYRELDRLVQQVMGTPPRPVSMPMDAYRDGETFVVHIDLPGVTAEAIDLQVEKNVLTVRAERSRSAADDSLKAPGETRVTSSRLSMRWRNSALLLKAQGERNKDNTAMANTMGSAKRSTGPTQAVSGSPEANQTTISESR